MATPRVRGQLDQRVNEGATGEKSRKRDELVTLGLVLVERTTSLEERLVHATTASNDADGGAGATRDGLL